MTMLLHWQGLHQHADWWQSSFHSGESADGMCAKLESAGLNFAETRKGEVSFLEWCVRTRRGAVIGVSTQPWSGQANHAILLVHLDAEVAGLLDNNSPHKVTYRPRAEFLAEWANDSGWALTLVHSPPPPRPVLENR